VLAGQESRPGSFDVTASAAGVPISTEYLPAGTEIEGLRAFAPHGSLALSAWGEVSFDGRTSPHAEIRLSLADGSVVVGNRQTIDRIQVDLEAKYSPRNVDGLFDLGAWAVTARSSGRWRDATIESIARLGGNAEPASLFTADLHVRELEVRHELLDSSAGRGPGERVGRARAAGEGRALAGFACARDWLPGEPIGPKVGFACEVGMHGAAGITYHGFPSRATGRRDQGFPLPLDAITGRVVCASDPRRFRTLKIGVDARGSAPRGQVSGRGLVCSPPANAPPDAPGHGYVEVDSTSAPITSRSTASSTRRSAGSRIRSRRRHVGTLRARERRDLGEVRVVRKVDMPYAATEVALDLEDVGITWAELPVPVSRARGTFEFRSDGRSEGGSPGGCTARSGPRPTRRRVPLPDGSLEARAAGGKGRIDEIVLSPSPRRAPR
jgi:hypothetical protein